MSEVRRCEKNTPPPIQASQSHSIIDLIDLGEDARASSVTPHPAAPALTAPLSNLLTFQQAWSAVQDAPNPARPCALRELDAAGARMLGRKEHEGLAQSFVHVP